jgi:FAD dependent oxidoreductase TIGR03364
MESKHAIVIGAGIAGLATAKALAQKGFTVKVIERSLQAAGASVRNFGMIWPVGQPSGVLYERAIRSRNIWKEIAADTGIGCEQSGSLHLAYHDDEMEVITELHDIFKKERRPVELMNAPTITGKYDSVNPEKLLGGLYSTDEMIVDPREAIAALPDYLEEKYNIEFHWGKCVSFVSDQTVYIGTEEEHEADLIIICGGADFETLFPEEYLRFPITKCKLQMMRLAAQPGNWRIGTSLCGGLSLIHYNSFKAAPSIHKLKQRYENEMSEYTDAGIHVMVSQNTAGELTVGDSHEYGLHFDPFDKACINKLILEYLKKFTRIKDPAVTQTWNGIYPKMTNGETDIFFSPEPGVYILNGLGGAGMTMGFGFAEECVDQV